MRAPTRRTRPRTRWRRPCWTTARTTTTTPRTASPAARGSRVGLKLKTGRVVLEQVRGRSPRAAHGAAGAERRQVVAARVLSGRRTSGAPSGLVALDGAVATPAQRRFAAAFAPQDDILPPHLTVAEHLRFHARLRLPARWPKKRAAARALREAEALGLTGAVLHATRLWRCSGGQRRRATLATALLARKRFVLADEPTTGLDAATALKVVGRLAALARGGTTVVCVLHQPRREIVRLLDRVALVAGGRPASSGRRRTSTPPRRTPRNPARRSWTRRRRPTPRALAALRAAAAARGAFVAPAVPAARRPPWHATLRLLAARERRACAATRASSRCTTGPPRPSASCWARPSPTCRRATVRGGIQDRRPAFVLCVAVGLSAPAAPPRARRAARLLARRDSYGGPAAFPAMCGVGDVPRGGCCRRCPAGLALAVARGAPGRPRRARLVAAALQLHSPSGAGRCLGALAPRLGGDPPRRRVPLQPAALRLLRDLDDLPAAWRRVARALPAASGYEALVVHEFSGSRSCT